MYKHFLKRLFDITVGLLGMIPFLFFFIIFAPIIWLTDRGPVFYNAPRLGKNGKVFKMYKFRSMRVNSPDIRNADGSTYNGANDPRVTKVGRFMRKTSIDEFPQFLNVLLGHMSLIGPRPDLATDYTGFENLDGKTQKSLQVRPGITGYSQAYYRNSIGNEQKLENDVYYVEHISFWLDVKVFFKTVLSVLKRENIYVEQPQSDAVPEEQKESAEVGKQ